MTWSGRCAACLGAARGSRDRGDSGAGLLVISYLRWWMADQRAGPRMNGTPLLSVVVGVVPVRRSDLTPWVNTGHLLLALVDWGGRGGVAGPLASQEGMDA